MSTPHIDRLLETALLSEASDIHLHAGKPPVLRVDGILRTLEGELLDEADTFALFKALASKPQLAQWENRGHVRFMVSYHDKARARVTAYREGSRAALSIRMLPTHPPGYDTLGLPTAFADRCRAPRGLCLVAGRAGSGRTSTVAALVDYVNHRHATHIFTVGAPLEFRHTPARAIMSSCEVGTDVETLCAAHECALASDADILDLGDLRSVEDYRVALDAADAGRLVLATVSAPGARDALQAIVGALSDCERVRTQLAGSLLAVFVQTLVPKITGGRVLAFELLLNTRAVSALIMKNMLGQIDTVIAEGALHGMQLLDLHLRRLYEAGVIDGRAAINHARNPAEMWRWLRARPEGGPTSPPV